MAQRQTRLIRKLAGPGLAIAMVAAAVAYGAALSSVGDRAGRPAAGG